MPARLEALRDDGVHTGGGQRDRLGDRGRGADGEASSRPAAGMPKVKLRTGTRSSDHDGELVVEAADGSRRSGTAGRR